MAGSVQDRGNGSYLLTYSMGFKADGKRNRKTRTIKAKHMTEAKKKLAAFETVGSWVKAIRISERESIDNLSKNTNIPREKIFDLERLNIRLSRKELLLIGRHFGIENLIEWFELHTGVFSTAEEESNFIDNKNENSKKYKISFDVPSREVIDAVNKNYQKMRILPYEEAKQRFLYLENLLTMDENIYLNKRVLTPGEKERALKILKLVFESDIDTNEDV